MINTWVDLTFYLKKIHFNSCQKGEEGGGEKLFKEKGGGGGN